MTLHSLGVADGRIQPCDLELCRGVPSGRDAHGWLTWGTLCVNLSDPTTLGEFKSLFYDATHYALSQGQSWTESDNLALYQWALDRGLQLVQLGPSGVLVPTRDGLALLFWLVCSPKDLYNQECDVRYPLLSRLLLRTGKSLAFFPPTLGTTQPMPPGPPGGEQEGLSLGAVAGYGTVAAVGAWALWRLLRRRRA